MKRGVLIGLGCAALIAGSSCFLLPDEYVIRGPMLRSMLGGGIDAPEPEVVETRLQGPPGYAVTLWAQDIPGARFMRWSPGRSLLVSQPRQGQIVHVLGDHDGDGLSDGQRILLADLDRPHGIDFREGHLYIGEASAIARVPFEEVGPDSISVSQPPERIVEGIPKGGNHWRRTLRFGPDGGLYLTVGSSCNVCEEEDPRRAAMLRYEPDGSGETIYAAGLRNATGFDWQPGTNDLYATDNGRDLLGDDYPPCELDRVVEGGFYGWPYANANFDGGTDPDPDFGKGHEAEIARTIPAAHPFRAHTAPLGITFVRHPDADPAFRDAALVALHGSWNRSELDGYEVVSLHWDAKGRITERPFLTGFRVGSEDVIGRPVDVSEGPEGAFYVSDDYAGVLYRVAPEGSSPRPSAAASRGGKPAKPRAVEDPLAEYDAATRESLERRGEALFVENACGTCHLQELAAPGVKLKKLEGLAQRYTVEGLEAFLLAPQPPMPIVDLPEADRRALAVYLLASYAK